MLDTHLGFSVPTLVTSVQGGQNAIVFPFAPVYDASQIKLVRASIFAQAFSVAANVMEVQVGYQISDDGVNWLPSTSPPLFFSASVSRLSEGVDVGAFEDITANLTKRFIRFVVSAKNTAGNTSLSTCLCSIRIERRAC